MLMPGRKFDAGSSYRYGFNGKEKSNEIHGEGKAYDFGSRIQDPRLGRWFSTDKFEAKYPAWSPYSPMMNNPLICIDVNGDSIELIIGKPYVDANGEEHPYGHVALRVYNAKEGYDKVYDFGRYGKTWGLMGKEGEGILNAYEKGSSYLKSEMSIRSSVGYMQPTTAAEDKQVIAHFSGLIQNGEVYKSGAVPGGGGTAYKLENDYDVFNNNCTTVSNGGLEVLRMDWLGGEYDPRDALKIMEGKYKRLRLTRTDYEKGGNATVTYSPPLPSQQTDFKIEPINTRASKDNTTIVKPVNVQEIKKKKN